MAKIFAYKGYLGINAFKPKSDSDSAAPEGEGLELLTDAMINDPTQPGQMGFIVDANKCQITQGAIDVLKKVKKSRDAIGDVMCWQAGDKVCFGWMGGPLYLAHSDDIEADRDYDPSLLIACEDFEIEQEFIDAIEAVINEE